MGAALSGPCGVYEYAVAPGPVCGHVRFTLAPAPTLRSHPRPPPPRVPTPPLGWRAAVNGAAIVMELVSSTTQGTTVAVDGLVARSNTNNATTTYGSGQGGAMLLIANGQHLLGLGISVVNSTFEGNVVEGMEGVGGAMAVVLGGFGGRWVHPRPIHPPARLCGPAPCGGGAGGRGSWRGI